MSWNRRPRASTSCRRVILPSACSFPVFYSCTVHVLEDEMPKKRLFFCRPLVNAPLQELEYRYGPLIRCDLNDNFTKDCALATFSIPGFKASWVPSDEA